MAGRDGTVYVIRNLLNGKCYVGQTADRLSNRLSDHKGAASPIGSAIRKYGWTSFEVLRFRVPSVMLDLFEIELIARLASVAPRGYNLSLGGQQHRGFCEESRKKMRLAHLGKKLTMEQRAKQSVALRGRCKSEEVRRHSEAQKGRPKSEATRAKIAAALIGNIPWNKGKPQSAEQRRINSESHRGRRDSAETRARKSAAAKGRNTWSRGRKNTDAYKRMMSERLKESWARRKAA